jgi:hypothetical protein
VAEPSYQPERGTSGPKIRGAFMQTTNELHSNAGEYAISNSARESIGGLAECHRLRFWEIEEYFKCPVVGWCLDIAEQKDILRKERISIKDALDFEIHEIVVNSLGDENRLSRRIDRVLNQKYSPSENSLFEN